MLGFIVLGVTALVLMKANKFQEEDQDGAAVLCCLGGTVFLLITYALFT